MKAGRRPILICLIVLLSGSLFPVRARERQPIKAVYLPLADHYGGVIAYEKYRGKMTKADFSIIRMRSLPLLRAYFMGEDADVAFIVCPMAMDMFAENPNFRWVSLMHRDGNALAINDLLNEDVKLSRERLKRKPDDKVAQAFSRAKARTGRPSECAVPSLLTTHTVVLYKYLKDHGKTLGHGRGQDKDVVAIPVAPAKSPSFIKKKNSRSIPASFEQSLPWSDVVETKGFGHVAWYSRDVIPWPKGHVECIIIATDECIKKKKAALKEVIYYIHKAGMDIEKARIAGGPEMIAISDMIRKHIPEHNQQAIIQSLRPDLNVINYKFLNIDKAGLKLIMDLAVEGGILEKAIDINLFADAGFSTKITEIPIAAPYTKYSGFPDSITQRLKNALIVQTAVLSNDAANPLIIKAVREQNAKGVTLDEIKIIDKEWIEGKRNSFALKLQINRAGVYLRKKVLSGKSLYVEAFLCDKQGAVVGEYPKTTDYWQGDEKKFTECYRKGSGKVYISPLELDESTQSFSVKISVPVMDGTDTIGVLILGLRNIK